MPKRILCGVILALLTGCMTVGPDYKRPAIDTPAAYRFERRRRGIWPTRPGGSSSSDPVLNGLVSTVLEQNKNLLIATARIEEFFGRYFFDARRPVPVGQWQCRTHSGSG